MNETLKLDTTVRNAETDAEIAECFFVMRQLRPHLNETDFVLRVRRQMLEGYRLVRLELAGGIVAVAGFRIRESLFLGRFLYVDDLVTEGSQRSKGYGKQLFRWLVDHARRERCTHVDLDSGLQRQDAHRFYLREGMAIRSHHFSRPLE